MRRRHTETLLIILWLAAFLVWAALDLVLWAGLQPGR